MPNEVSQLLGKLVFEEKMTQEAIEEKLNIKVYNIQKSKFSGYEQVSIKEAFKFFRHINIHRYSTLKKPAYVFYIEPSVRRIIAIYYDKPANSGINAIEASALVETDYIYDKGQIDIILELPRLMAYAQQRNIRVSGKGKPAASTLSKMRRKLNLVEFYPNATLKPVSLLRTNLLAGLITLIGTVKSSVESHTFIKTLLQSYYSNRYQTIHQLLTYFKGTGHIDEYYLERVEPHFIYLLGELPENEWVGIDNILKFLKFSFKDIRPIREYIARNKIYYEYDGVVNHGRYSYNESKHYIDNSRYERAITLPTLKGTLFLFAAFGLLDMAYDEIDATVIGQTCDSPFDGLKYIRLNSLGAYVSGQQAKYEAPQEISQSTIELSKDSLTIISDKDDPTAAVILEPYTEKVTPNRFRTDFAIFLNGVTNKKELADKIKLFKQSVTDDLPTNWVTFFEQLHQKIDPLTTVSNLLVFQIPNNNPDLIKLIARDVKLKNMCFKAEGYHVLVPKKKFAQFKARLREFGYLMSK